MKLRINQKKSEKDHGHKTVREHFSELLQRFGVRPTRQRLDISSLLFDGPHKHITAEELQLIARSRKIRVSLATIYNSLNQFVKAGMIKEACYGGGKTYFDTNTKIHHHFFDERTGSLWDIPPEAVKLDLPPDAPYHLEEGCVEVTVRLRKTA